MTKQMNRSGYFAFTVLKGGDLEIRWRYDDRPQLYTLAERKEELATKGYNYCFGEWFSHYWENGWTMVRPEQLSALTSAPIIGRDVCTMADKIESLCDDIRNVAGRDNISVEITWLRPDPYPLMESVVGGDIWYFPNYMVENELETLIAKGSVVFTRVED